VALQRRLPCPADATIADPSHVSYGREMRSAVTGDCLNGQINGVLPWVDIGVAKESVQDGFDTMVTYRVAPGLTRTDAMNWSACDPAGDQPASGIAPNQACATTCSSADVPGTCTKPANIVAGRGLQMRDASGNITANPAATPSTGVAYVLISHGDNRAGGYSSAGYLQEAAGTAAGAGEAQNAANLVLQTYYVDAPGASDFDDMVARPGLIPLATKAGIAPRAH
jgi:hypothetical protein